MQNFEKSSNMERKLAKNEEPFFCGSFLVYPKIVFWEPIPLLLYYVSFDGWRNFLRKVIKNSTHNTFIFFWHNLLFCNWLIYFFEIKFSYTIAIFFWKIVLSENLVSFKKCNGEKAVCFLKIYTFFILASLSYRGVQDLHFTLNLNCKGEFCCQGIFSFG